MVPEKVNVNTVIENRLFTNSDVLSGKGQTKAGDVQNVGNAMLLMARLPLESYLLEDFHEWVDQMHGAGNEIYEIVVCNYLCSSWHLLTTTDQSTVSKHDDQHIYHDLRFNAR